jgi:hypothetical protein
VEYGKWEICHEGVDTRSIEKNCFILKQQLKFQEKIFLESLSIKKRKLQGRMKLVGDFKLKDNNL